MKKIFLTAPLLLFFALKNSGQINIDSLIIFSTNSAVVDSVFIGGMSSGQELEDITLLPTNDACGTVHITLVFRGCLPVQTTTFDTLVHIGFPTQKINITTLWDTLASCPFPEEPMSTDTATWDNCSALGLNQKVNEEEILIYPNPSNNVMHITTPQNIQIVDVEVFDALGKEVNVPRKKHNEFCLSTIPSGTYHVKITTNRGPITKKMVKE